MKNLLKSAANKQLALILFLLFFSQNMIAQIQAPDINKAVCAECGTVGFNPHKNTCIYYTCPNCGTRTKGKAHDCSKKQTPSKQLNSTTNDPLEILKTGIKLIEDMDKNPEEKNNNLETEEEIKSNSIKEEKHRNLTKQLKPLDDPSKEKKMRCIKAQKEIYRLQNLKLNFEKQLLNLEKWHTDLDNYRKEFIDDRNNYTKDWGGDLLNLIPIEKIKGPIKVSKKALEGEKLEKALNATKILNSTTGKLLEKNDTLSDEDLSQVKITNDSYKYTGELLESLAPFTNKKYQESLEAIGKTLQLNGTSLNILDDMTQDNLLNNTVDVASIFLPLARITAAGTKLTAKVAYELIADYRIHQLSTTKSENVKAQDFLKNKINEIDTEILKNKNIIQEYLLLNPKGCPIE